MSFSPSKYQQAIFDFVTGSTGNAVVNAVAGSGKTTTIVKALTLIPNNLSTCFLAFNKSIVNELQERVPSHVNVQTLHSLGWSAIGRTYNRPKLNSRKIFEIINELVEVWKQQDSDFDGELYDREYLSRVSKLADLLRVDLCETPEELELLAIKHDIEVINGECKHAFEVVQKALQDKTQFDFTDMLYVAATDSNIKMFKYDWIFVDECQDLNKAQQQLLKNIMKPTSRFIAVGDPQQAIYGFAGADVNSFRNLVNFSNTTELPLSVNYRCGKNIINKAKVLVSHLEYFENAIDGEVRENASVKDIEDGDMVLCRNTAPLVQLCLEFISKGRKATVKGSDIGANLINLVKKSKARNLNGVWSYLENELAKVYRKLSLRYPHESQEDLCNMPSYRLLSEKITVLQIISDQSQSVTNPQNLISKIGEIFSEKIEGIMLSTIHKAKGLESNNVFIIERGLMPSKYAKQAWQKEQERNLEYVAYTRPKKLLGFVEDWSYNRDREIGLNKKLERRQEISKQIDEQIPQHLKSTEDVLPKAQNSSTLDLSQIKGRKNQVKALLEEGINNVNTIAEMIGTHPSYVHRLIKELN